MSLTLIKEDGTGKVDANSYAAAADGDAYHDGHVYASVWTAATTGNKEKALVMATRFIDASYEFNGFKNGSVQALQWPRQRAVDPDRKNVTVAVLDSKVGPYFDNDKIPKALADATCEMARELLTADRTGAPDGEGIKFLSIVGTIAITFDKTDRLPVISHLAQCLLAKLGTLVSSGGGMARLVRT